MNYYTISKKEAMFRVQRLVASSGVRFFLVGEVNASQVADVIRLFQNKYNILADKNERKRLERAGEPIWHCVLWYDYINIGRMYYYLFTTGYKKPKDIKKSFDVEKKNAELVAQERLKDLYGGDLLTFGRYVLGQYVDYESPYDKNTKGFQKEYRHPEQFKDMFIPSLFNYVRTGNYYRTFKERMDKKKLRYMSEQHLPVTANLEAAPIDQTDTDLHTDNDIESLASFNTEAEKELIALDQADNPKSPEYIAADKMVRQLRYKQFHALKGYAAFELNPMNDIELISDMHPNFRSDLNYEEIQQRVQNEINGLHKRVERISRPNFINELGKFVDAKTLHSLSHQGLKELWLNVQKRRIYLYYNRLCEDRTRTVRWTWYVRKNAMWDINQQMKYAIRHMGRGGDEFVRALRALYRMAGFHGVRHQIGRVIAKAKREAKHAFPKVFAGLDVPNTFGYITTIPITIHSLKEFHDECITASIKHYRTKTLIDEREARRGDFRKALRAKPQMAQLPTYELDKLIDEEFSKWFTIKITAEDIYEFLKKHDDMNPKHLNLDAIRELATEELDRDVVSDHYERHVYNSHNPKSDNGDIVNDKPSRRSRTNKTDGEDKTSGAKTRQRNKSKTDEIVAKVDAELKSELDKTTEKESD